MQQAVPPMSVAANNLVRGVEVWRPAGDELALSHGAYGQLGHVCHGRVGRRAAKGEGVVGGAWASGSPVLRTADRFGHEEFPPLPVGAAVAIPAMCAGRTAAQEECRGVVTLLCEGADDRQGAVEVWRPNDRSELGLSESWYANLERFGLISGFVKFPRRAGLPGKVWNDRFPRVMGALGESADFVRVAGAKADGISTAIGIPFMRTAREIEAVLLLLSASKSPLARAMEVWAPEPKTETLKVVSADYGPYVDLAPLSRRRRVRAGEGLAGRVFQDRSPWVTSDLLGVEFPLGDKLAEYGFEWGVGLPVFVGADLFAVVTLLQ
ncbi:MAG: hypothetical protein AAGB00_05390 [Planctomycetota bacterium]